MLTDLDVDAADVSAGSVLVPYWFSLVCKLTFSVDIASKWWTLVSVVGGAPRALVLDWRGCVFATNPWTSNGFWSTIGGGPCGAGLGCAWVVALAAYWTSFRMAYLARPMRGHSKV